MLIQAAHAPLVCNSNRRWWSTRSARKQSCIACVSVTGTQEAHGRGAAWREVFPVKLVQRRVLREHQPLCALPQGASCLEPQRLQSLF